MENMKSEMRGVNILILTIRSKGIPIYISLEIRITLIYKLFYLL